MGRTKTLGLVLPDASNPFFAELARAVENAAFVRGYAVMVCSSADDATREHTYIQSLADRRVDGLILISASSSQDLSDLTGISIPVVALDRTPDESPISTIRSNNEDGAYLGTSHLIPHGHRRIAFVGGPDAGVTDARRQGWRKALALAGLPSGPEQAVPFTYQGGNAAALSIFGARPRRTRAQQPRWCRPTSRH